MKLKTYRAPSIADALGQIKSDLGSDAVILHTRSIKHGGLLGFGSKRLVEITASASVNVPEHPALSRRRSPGPAAKPLPRTDPAILQRAYASTVKPLNTEMIGANLSATVAEFSPVSSPTAVAIPAPVVPAPAEPVPETIRTAIAQENTAASADAPGIWDEMRVIKRMVGQVLQSSTGHRDPGMPEHLFNHYLRLIESEVASEIADEIVGGVRDELNSDELAEESVVHQAVLRRLAAYLPTADDAPGAGAARDGRPLTIAVVGPTGVGKTTTIAKLAATYKLRHGKSVGLITCDTYRIAAVEQLRTYANIINLPLKVVLTPKEVANACDALRDHDVILIDTAGRSQHDTSKIGELSDFLHAARPHQTHLVLSSASSQNVILRAAERFKVARPNRVIFTKLDEAVNFGVIVNAAKTIGVKLSYVTTGQEVPDDIEPSHPDRIARLVLGGAGAP